MDFFNVFTVAILVERVTEYLKMAIPSFSEKKGLVVAFTVILGIAGALAFNADIFLQFGIKSAVPYVGNVLTGIVCAGGSNYIYDIVSSFSKGIKPEG